MKPLAVLAVVVAYAVSLALAATIIVVSHSYAAGADAQANALAGPPQQHLDPTHAKIALAAANAQLRLLRSELRVSCAAQAHASTNAQTQLLALSERLIPTLGPHLAISAYTLTAPNPSTPAPSRPSAQTHDAVTSGPSLALTIHGPSPVLFHALDTLTHRDDTLAFMVSSIVRGADGDVDAKLTVTTEDLPDGACR